MKRAIAALKTLVPAKVIQSSLHKRIFTQFAEKYGLVYFGYVDQRSDEHRLVRGLTVSGTYRDNHYCIGSFGGYDITLVERSDTLRFPGKPSKNHTWIIMEFDLHTSADLPHLFVGLHAHSDTFYSHLFTKFSHLTKVPLAGYGTYDSQFLQRYAVYSSPSQFEAAQQLIGPDMAKIIVEHFGSLTFEIMDNCLYVYTEHQHPTSQLLERMLKNGMWLAKIIDGPMVQNENGD